jgi:hypothetical protein
MKYIVLFILVLCYVGVVLTLREGMENSATTTVKVMNKLSDWLDAKETIQPFLTDVNRTRYFIVLPFESSQNTDKVIDLVNELGMETDLKMIFFYVPPLLDVVKTELFDLIEVDSPPTMFIRGMFTFQSGSEIPTEADYNMSSLLINAMDDLECEECEECEEDDEEEEDDEDDNGVMNASRKAMKEAKKAAKEAAKKAAKKAKEAAKDAAKGAKDAAKKAKDVAKKAGKAVGKAFK